MGLAAIRRFLKRSGSGAAATKNTRVPVQETFNARMETWDVGLDAGEKVVRNFFRTGKLMVYVVAGVTTVRLALMDLIDTTMKEGARVRGVLNDFKTRAKDLAKEMCEEADREDPARTTKETLLCLEEQQRTIKEILLYLEEQQRVRLTGTHYKLKLQHPAEEPHKDVTTQKKGPK